MAVIITENANLKATAEKSYTATLTQFTSLGFIILEIMDKIHPLQ